jgi:L-ascorbate metabolism protein UlaG (beta-lactamase superfamily)
VGPVDVVLLTHDHHADNLDDLGRMVLNGAGTVLTTESGARRLGGPTVGLAPWDHSRLTAPGRPSIDVTATPARHGPPLSRFLVGDVIGFALAWEQQCHGVLWISGDTVLHGGVREAARRLVVDVAVLHLGAVRFPVTGPVRYTMSARQAVVACRMLRPRTVVPVHYEGWSHFRQGRSAVERALAAAPDVRERVQWLDPGVPRSVDEPC